MPRETIENRGGSFYARRDPEGQFTEMSEKGRSLKADRRTKAKTTVKSGDGDRGDQRPRAKKTAPARSAASSAKKQTAARTSKTARKKAPAKKK